MIINLIVVTHFFVGHFRYSKYSLISDHFACYCLWIIHAGHSKWILMYCYHNELIEFNHLHINSLFSRTHPYICAVTMKIEQKCLGLFHTRKTINIYFQYWKRITSTMSYCYSVGNSELHNFSLYEICLLKEKLELGKTAKLSFYFKQLFR